MLHFYIGTKAQYVKLVPVIREAEHQRVPYRIIDAGFHRGLMEHVVDSFAMRSPDAVVGRNTTEVRTVLEAIGWLTRTGMCPLLSRRRLFRDVFAGQDGLCVTHGDTLATLVALLHAKRCGLPVAHVEAGPRSWHYLDPFPEEIVRVIVMRYADILFAPGQWACENISRSKHRGRVVNTHFNTVVETAKLAAEMGAKHQVPLDGESYCVVTFHRAESLLRRERVLFLADLVRQVAKDREVAFVLHGPTEKALRKHSLYETLAKTPNVVLSPLLDYCEFASLIHGADFVMTDGGSIQEECAFLGKPCLLLRVHTERTDGLGQNVVLSKLHSDAIQEFLDRWPTLERPGMQVDMSPSRIIVEELREFVGFG